MSLLPFYDQLEKSLLKARDTSGLRLPGWPLFFLGVLMLFNAFLYFPGTIKLMFSIMVFLAPVWLSLLILSATWSLWLNLKRSEFIASRNYLLLEIKPPRSIVKTPLAMETMLAGLHHPKGESNWYQIYVLGQVRPYWSLEIVSLEGQVHFYIWTRADFRKLVEAAMYAQYPGAQVVEAPDYTKIISAKPGEEWGVWGCDFKHTQKDPYPLKTYVEYGLDKVSKEPEQVDPLSNLIEFAGSLGKGEYLWIQYIARVHSGRAKYHGKKNKEGKEYTWKDEAKEIVEEMRKKSRDSYIDAVTGEVRPGFPNPTKGQSETMAAIERNVSKLAFDVGARAVYIAKPDRFDPINITGIIGLFKAFSSEGWNGLKATRWLLEYNDYPWELGNTKRKLKRAKELVNAYRRRQYFYEPFPFHDYMTLSTEELATLYHVPSYAVESPALPRIQSATAEPPVNLPT
ncbi:MAG: hypothetical protein Q7R54_00295 [bacterium]|nr:hypothetical protein [bacterium]